MGNYGRTKLNPHAESFVSTIWEQFAFMANSLIFILIGVMMVQPFFLNTTILLAIAITVFVVALARALSIYPVIYLYNLFQASKRTIPLTWQHLLAWGSLRGALAVTMVFLIPDDLTVANWNVAITPKEFLLAITVGCIAATLFIKATTIRRMVRKFKLDDLTPVEEVEYQEARALIHHEVTDQLLIYEKRGYIDPVIAENLRVEHAAAFKKACTQANALSSLRRDDLAFRVLRIYAIGIEKRHLKMLYDHQEVTESVFRRIQGKLRLQLEAIESGNLSPDVTIHVDRHDIFDGLFQTIKALIKRETEKYSFSERYMYYRAQSIISRKVVKELIALEQVSKTIFTPEAVKHVHELYLSFRENSEKKLRSLSAEDVPHAQELAKSLAEHGVHTIEEKVLEDIYRKELITPKLYITLKEELRVTK
jgi:CPA1 family monovalent cation:H+ antiporter